MGATITEFPSSASISQSSLKVSSWSSLSAAKKNIASISLETTLLTCCATATRPSGKESCETSAVPESTSCSAARITINPRPPASTTPDSARIDSCFGVCSNACSAASNAATTTATGVEVSSSPFSVSTARPPRADSRNTVSTVPSTGLAMAVDTKATACSSMLTIASASITPVEAVSANARNTWLSTIPEFPRAP